MTFFSGIILKHSAALALCAIAIFLPSSALALTISGPKGQGLESIYGSYAPRGDCNKEPRVTISDRGFTFLANGRAITPPRLEYAVSYMGRDYEGIMKVFFPFPLSEDDFGRLLMFVNDNEKRGTIRFEADIPRGQRADPFQAALTGAGLFIRCKNSR